MKKVFQYLCIFLAAAGVFLAAKYLDGSAVIALPITQKDAVQVEAVQTKTPVATESVFDKYAEETENKTDIEKFADARRDKMAEMRYVVLPSILSTVVIMLITRIGSLLNVGYEKVLLLYNYNTHVTADVVSTFAQRYGILAGRIGVSTAAEMLNNVVGMLLVIGANTIARKASDVSLY